MDRSVGPLIRLSAEELMLSNCGAGEDSWESLGLQGDQPWIFIAGLMLKLKLQCFNHLMWRANSLEKTLMLGKIEGRRRRGWQRMRWLDDITESIWVWVNSRKWWRTGKPAMLQSMESHGSGHNLATKQQETLLWDNNTNFYTLRAKWSKSDREWHITNKQNIK